jgi:hypothetical protein
MSAVSLPAYGVRTGARLSRRLLVVAAIGQAVSSILVSTFGGAFTTADRAGEPPIVPARVDLHHLERDHPVEHWLRDLGRLRPAP